MSGQSGLIYGGDVTARPLTAGLALDLLCWQARSMYRLCTIFDRSDAA
jgi:hypothetical protein